MDSLSLSSDDDDYILSTITDLIFTMKHCGKIEDTAERDSQTSLEENLLGIIVISVIILYTAVINSDKGSV